MPMNRIQFQSGLSLPDFLHQFGTRGPMRGRAGASPLAQKKLCVSLLRPHGCQRVQVGSRPTSSAKPADAEPR